LRSGASRAQVRVDQTPQKGEVRTTPRGKGYSPGTHGVLTGYLPGPPVPRVLKRYSRDQTGTAGFVRFRVSPIRRACTTRARTPTPLRQTLPPVLSCGLLACFSRHMCCGACRSLARASSRSTWCVPVTGVLVQYMWEVNGTGVLCHVHSLANCTRALTRAYG
jgi:hypothetical protein